MKVLIVLAKDGPNLFCESIVKALEQRHEIRVFAAANDDNSLRMFKGLKAPIQPVQKMTDKDAQWADCIFSPVQALRKIAHIPKYIFSFCNMNPHFDVVRGADFVFTLNHIEQPAVPYFASMPVGLPKNDMPVAPSLKAQKRFLYVDSGHYPFGKRGRIQIAEMLLRICRAYPDYEMVFKPRWLPNAGASSRTHINFDHLYNILAVMCPNGLPSNLRLLQEHINLQALIDQSDCVITLCSTAFLDVALRGKPQLIISGLENEDMFEVRSSYFDNIYEFAMGSGCVVNVQDVLEALPEGRMCNAAYIESAFAYRSGATQRVLEVMEYIGTTLLPQQQFPAAGEYHYDNYRDELQNTTYISHNDLQRNRLFCQTLDKPIWAASISRHLNWKAFHQEQYALCNEAAQRISEQRDPVEIRAIVATLEKSVESLKCDYVIEHADFVQNDVDASYLYFAMHKRGQYDELMQLYHQAKKPHESLTYYAGMIYGRQLQYADAANCLQRYLEESLSRDYLRYIIDSYRVRLDAFKHLIVYQVKLKAWKGVIQTLRSLVNCLMQYFQGTVSFSSPEAKMHITRKQRINMKFNKLVAAVKICLFMAKKLNHKVRKSFRMQYEKRKNQFYKLWYTVKRVAHIYDRQDREVLRYQNTHQGEACFIIGNGPSLTPQDLEHIQAKGYSCFASNKIYKIFDQTDWRPDYYACVDTLVFQQNLYDILPSMHCPVFLNASFKRHAERYQQVTAHSLSNVHYMRYLFGRKGIPFYPQAALVISGGTVTFTLMELAWMMGFRKLYLVGCDHNYGVYSNANSTGENTLQADKRTSNDHFSAHYMRQGEMMFIGNLDKATRGYESARKYIESHGGEVYNATRGGKLEVFKRIDLDELLK